MAEHETATAFYDSHPWEGEFGPGVPTEFTPLPFRNLGEMIRRAAVDYAGNTAFTVCLDNGLNASLRFHEVETLSDRFMAYLRDELRLQPGDRVAIQMPNCLAYPIATFGTLKAGCVLVNVNPLYTAPEMNAQLKDSGARVLVLIDLFADKLEKALEGTRVEKVLLAGIADFFPTPKRLLIQTVLKLKRQLPRPNRPFIRFTEALAAGRRHLGAPANANLVDRTPEDLAALQYTGGTTGVAKGAELSHASLLANIAQIEMVAGPLFRRGEDKVLTALPLYHIFAFTFNLMCFYRSGAQNVLCPSPRPVNNLRKAFEKFEISKFSGVNLLFHGLNHEEWFRNRPPRQLDLTVAGGTALHRSVGEEWLKVVGTPLLEGYGLTETSPVLTVNPPRGENRLGTIGVPLPGTRVRIVDADDQPVPCGQMGELIAQGPQLFRGYWQKPEETEQTMRGGWFHTGDIAVMDERGYLTVVDRKKDMIDVSGFNVFPNEIEECLDSHPDVAEVAVIGVPAGAGGERVRAYVVSKNPALTAEELVAYARERLTKYKVPKEIIFRDSLPKTPVGKILRKDLRAEARDEPA